MLIRLAIATAFVAVATPVVASDYDAKARPNAANRCAMKQHRIPAGKTVTAPIVSCQADGPPDRNEVAYRDEKKTNPEQRQVAKD